MGCCGKIIHGATGLAKSALGIGIAPDDVIESRRAICRACDRATDHPLKPGRKLSCAACGCILSHKTRLASEACPDGKWGEAGKAKRYIFCITEGCAFSRLLRDTLAAHGIDAQVRRSPVFMCDATPDAEAIQPKLAAVRAARGVYVETCHTFIAGWGWEIVRHLPHEEIMVIDGVAGLTFDADRMAAWLEELYVTPNWIMQPYGNAHTMESLRYHLRRTVELRDRFIAEHPDIAVVKMSAADLGNPERVSSLLEAMGVADVT